MKIEAHYWYAGGDIHTDTKFQKCLNKKSCDVEGLSVKCTTGYNGPICGECADGFVRSGSQFATSGIQPPVGFSSF